MLLPVKKAVILDPVRLDGDMHKSLSTEKEGRPWAKLYWCGADYGMRVEHPKDGVVYIPAARVECWYPEDPMLRSEADIRATLDDIDRDTLPMEPLKRGPGRPRKNEP